MFWTLLTFVFSVAIFKDIPEKLKQKQKLKNFSIKIYITTKDCCAPLPLPFCEHVIFEH